MSAVLISDIIAGSHFGLLYGAQASMTVIAVHPQNPTSDDNIEVRGQVSGCTADRSLNVDGSVLEVHLLQGEFCFSAPLPLLLSVGRLEAGDYSIVVYEPLLSSPEVLGAPTVTQAFTVVQGVQPFPVQVPAMGPAGLVLLAACLICIARMALQKGQR